MFSISSETEALWFQLDPRRVAAWLIANGLATRRIGDTGEEAWAWLYAEIPGLRESPHEPGYQQPEAVLVRTLLHKMLGPQEASEFARVVDVIVSSDLVTIAYTSESRADRMLILGCLRMLWSMIPACPPLHNPADRVAAGRLARSYRVTVMVTLSLALLPRVSVAVTERTCSPTV